MKTKRSQIQTVLILIFSSAIIILLFFFGFKYLNTLTRGSAQVSYQSFLLDFADNVKAMKYERGVTKNFAYDIINIEKICFFDLRYRNIISKTPEILSDPILLDAILEKNSDYSMVLYEKKKGALPQNFENISIPAYPYYYCFESPVNSYDFYIFSGNPPTLLISLHKCIQFILDKGLVNNSIELTSSDSRFILEIPKGTNITNLQSPSQEVNEICIDKVSLNDTELKTEKYNLTPSWLKFGNKEVILKYKYYPIQNCGYSLGFSNLTYQSFQCNDNKEIVFKNVTIIKN